MNDERGFLRALREDPNDEVSRLVYADWLEERGSPRGEFLRLEVELSHMPADDPRRAEGEARLSELRASLDPGWLARLDRTPIENCGPGLTFLFPCPKRWEELQDTNLGPAVRFCHECERNVYHCGSVEEAQERARDRLCVAVDSRLVRTEGDLGEADDQMVTGLPLHLPGWEDQPGTGMPPQEPPARRPWWKFW
jgi:uncharacterized protein (TIGR02996 family)